MGYSTVVGGVWVGRNSGLHKLTKTRNGSALRKLADAVYKGRVWDPTQDLLRYSCKVIQDFMNPEVAKANNFSEL